MPTTPIRKVRIQTPGSSTPVEVPIGAYAEDILMSDAVGADDLVTELAKKLEASDLPGDFAGASASTAGTHGLVPAPAAGDQDKFLKADGTWAAASGGGNTINNVTDGTGLRAVIEGAVSSGTVPDPWGSSTWNYDINIASGSLSHAEGMQTSAIGNYGAHTEGRRTLANGQGSHAEGWFTTANGRWSHTEGSDTIASTDGSHAEGDGAKAIGSISHAEGDRTTASGSVSHAEGAQTSASGIDSHAEGDRTIASGDYSHAEGTRTSAIGYNSHAEGNRTITNGDCSHAEGAQTSAIGHYSHAEGDNTSAGYIYQHVQGSYNDNKSDTLFEIGNGSNAGTLIRNNAFEVYNDGKISQDNGTTKFKFTSDNGVKGYIDESGTFNAFSSGNTINNVTDGTGERAVIEGAVTSGTHMGDNYTANVASGAFSHAEGYETTASGDSSHAEGQSTSAYGYASHVEGYQTTASGDSSHAEGENTTASGNASHAEGRAAAASGENSHAEGYRTIANNYQSHAEGYATTASGESSHAEGDNTIAGYNYQHIQGKYNDNKSNTLFEIGNGTQSLKKNIFEVYNDGSLSTDNGVTKVKLENLLPTSAKGAASGVAELDSNGKVPSSQLPSYVDDVIEGYYNTTDGKFYAESTYTTEITGETGKIYVSLDTNKSYRWSGSAFVEIGQGLALGETSSTAYRGDKGKDAYDHATESGKISAAVTEGLYKIAATAQGHIASTTAVTKSDITALGIPGAIKEYEATTGSVGSASGWNAGSITNVAVSGDTLNITLGVVPTLTITSTTVATGIQEKT